MNNSIAGPKCCGGFFFIEVKQEIVLECTRCGKIWKQHAGNRYLPVEAQSGDTNGHRSNRSGPQG